MHSHDWGSHRVNFDDDDFNSFRGITCDGQTHTQADTVSSILLTFQSLIHTNASGGDYGGELKFVWTEYLEHNSVFLSKTRSFADVTFRQDSLRMCALR